MRTKSPRIVTSALLLPADQVPGAARVRRDDATSREDHELAVQQVLAQERTLGRNPVAQPPGTAGYNVLSTGVDGEVVRILVRAQPHDPLQTVVSYNEILMARNATPRYRLALVARGEAGARVGEVRYVAEPFAQVDLRDYESAFIRGDWNRLWEMGRAPF